MEKMKTNTLFLWKFVGEGRKSGCVHQQTSLWQATADFLTRYKPSFSPLLLLE